MVKLLILKGQGKAFCAGGDVVGMVLSINEGHWSFGASFYKKQLTLDYLLATSTKPLVSLINGIVMGGGAGLSMNSMFRVVTENTVFIYPLLIIL
ncbi:putative 3-hydroxyisobutyryl-CoA hydrolase 3 [Vitis vinifera]|uniref:3-hydroxyisobutyryl-CoA hydrolase n=1 Tax=Vitis vinifera TaxID=29760 RepID=A0A438G5Z0_VITVI|nr:putative 3-hydroxyisobutyryl-CoA hydrolase 3 [Vitis vinifera]RVW67622.1 putative 3-hydroxyisobutyryl-CoA hydrolase 3 [Vitis vinifera]